MKLLDPFAGYRLASGHPFFHIALFVSSFAVAAFGEDHFDTNNVQIKDAFYLLRWSHFVLFTLSLVQGYASQPSDIPKQSAETENPEDKERETLKVYHRDGSWKLFARICSTISVFAYQGCVFYAQLVLADELLDCVGNKCTIVPMKGNRVVWLLLETCCFYLYVLATVFYIAWRQFAGIWGSELQSDMNKALQDFIEYANLNLTWFSFNFVLCAMPPICLYVIQSQSLQKDHETGSYKSLMYTLWAAHCISWFAHIRIYRIAKIPEAGSSTQGGIRSKFDKDDDFKLADKKIDQTSSQRRQSVLPSESINTISFEQHYVKMTRTFDNSHRWVFILNGLITLGCFIAFFFIDGQELVYALYIPLDVLLNACKTAFYWYYFWIDQKEKKEQERLTAYIEKKAAKKAQVTESLMVPNSGAPAQYDSDSSAASVPSTNDLIYRRKSTKYLAKAFEENKHREQQAENYLKEIIKKEEKLGLGGDTYAMAFKAFNWEVMRELDLDMDEVHNSFHAAMFVFGFQLLMIVFIGTIIVGDSFQITLPENTAVLGARFVCTILMHLQVEGDMRQGLRMMKYVTNQPFDFSNPASAFFVALMQTMGGLAAELACILYLGSINVAIDVIIKFVALASIAKVDDIYASALPADGNKIKKPTKPLMIRIHKRDWTTYDQRIQDGTISEKDHDLQEMAQQGIARKVGRFVFKSLRIMYAANLFYFLPYASLFLPYIVSVSQT